MQRVVLSLLLLAVAVAAAKPSATLLSKKRPLSSSEKASVGNALKNALGALQGHGGGSKYMSCMSYFSDGIPANKEKDVMWQSCKDELPADFGKKHASLLAKIQKGAYLTDQQKMVVKDAIDQAMGALEGHHGHSKPSAATSRCETLFPKDLGAPKDLTNPDWVACKDQLPSDYFGGSAMRQMLEMMSPNRH